jgi:hypothetical protein
MKNESFYDILVKKIQTDSVTSPSPQSHPSIRSLNEEKIATDILWSSLFTETIQAKLKVTRPKTKKRSVETTFIDRQVKNQNEENKPAPVVIERWVTKSSLDEDGISKWNLFEKTVGLSLGEKTHPAMARSVFRQFLKKVHPDLSGEKATHNFSTLVKIKDEFICVLDSYLEKKS